jgi:hypothetical protein
VSAADLALWGIVIHLVVDWLGQNEWVAVNKPDLRHPAGWVHASMHGAAQLLVFPWWGALAIGVTHLLIDTRVPVAWWSRLIRQTQPEGRNVHLAGPSRPGATPPVRPLWDIGADVRIWADQVWHIAVVALVALLAAS